MVGDARLRRRPTRQPNASRRAAFLREKVDDDGESD